GPGKNIPLLPWMELVRNGFGITKQDGDDTARQKIAGRLLLPAPGLHDALPVMFDFLGVPDPARPAPRLTPEAMQRELVGIVSRFQPDRARRGGLSVYLVEELAIPPTVHAVLAARIDRLPEREKAVLQTAAVIGRELPEPLLGRVAELPPTELAAAVQSLMAAEFLYEEAPYPEVEYAFKH